MVFTVEWTVVVRECVGCRGSVDNRSSSCCFHCWYSFEYGNTGLSDNGQGSSQRFYNQLHTLIVYVDPLYELTLLLSVEVSDDEGMLFSLF